MYRRQEELPYWSTLLPRLAPYLPASLFNRLLTLPEDLEQLDSEAHPGIVRDLLTVTRTLEPLHRVLVQYMPRYLNELDPTPGQAQGELLEGTFIFADLTGFTALTELLSRQGQARGHELMNQIMNRLFTEILDPLIASGGDLLIFAGDAALVYFARKDNDDDILQATRAALRMERAILPFASFETDYGHCSLTMSAGVERGVAYSGIVGTPQRMELLISGSGIHAAMDAETQAEPGQVMLGKQAQAIAREYFTMEGSLVVDNLGDNLGDYEISPPTRKRGGSIVFGMTIPETLKTVEVALQRVEQLAPFLPQDMLAHLVNTDRHRKLISEFRPVAVQFINVVGLEELAATHGPDIATKVFQRYFVDAEEIITQHEGIISQIDAYAQGFFFLNTFGTPKVHEGTTRYAVSAALQLAKMLEQINREFKLDPPLKQRGGITYGLVFNGEIGAQYRRESVVAGPAVNRAARLMSKAAFGQVILDANIWENIHTAFVGESLPSVRLKGIEGQVVIVNVHEIRRGTRLQSLERPLLGRAPEQAKLARSLEMLLQAHQWNAWMISGETGIGKTSLILDLAEKARQQGLTVLAGRCQPHGKHIPLFVWIDLLTGWLDIDESADLVKERLRLTKELEQLGLSGAEKAITQLLAFSQEKATPEPTSLFSRTGQRAEATPAAVAHPQGSLAALLGQRLGQAQHPSSGKTTLWKRLEERIQGPPVILKLLEALSQRQPLLIILEDVHWLDNESTFLLEKLLARIPDFPLVLALTGREPLAIEGMRFMQLGGLSHEVIAQVAQRVFGAHALDASLATWMSQQANGNPLYAQELCQALQQNDATFLDRETGEVRWTRQAPTLPLSLHELMLARLDELPLTQQEILKRAAVIGVAFDYEVLRVLCDQSLSESELDIGLERTIRAGFLVETQAKSYRFHHPLMQEAIYATLSFSQRQSWHAQAGNWLIEHQLEQALELISYHCLRGDDERKAAHYSRRAGDRAREQEAYAGALTYYEQVLQLQEAPTEEKQQAAESLGDVLMILREYPRAETAYHQAAELGSVAALGKVGIVSRNLDLLARAELPPMLQAWVKASQAYVLAQNNQRHVALDLAYAALELAPEPARPALQSLAQTLETRQRLEPYDRWLQQFTEVVLS